MIINKILIIPLLMGFLTTVIIAPIIIPFLRKLKFGQFVRELGPESHLKKAGTPTMGGIIFLLGMLFVCAFYIKDYPSILPVILTTFGFGFIGFVDDYIKVVKKNSKGLKALHKLIGQGIITLLFAIYILKIESIGTKVLIPFFGTKEFDLGIFYIPILFFIMLGTTNGSNFTDGLDGLCTSVTSVICSVFAIMSIFISGFFGDLNITPVISIFIGTLLGFLIYNVYPAKVFMGDTGSLAIGGFVTSVAYILRNPFIIAIVAFVYLMEVVSVIIQVLYFKKTGKRIFKMAPIHHHFELSGWPETKVVSIFTIITILLGLLGLFSLFY